MFTAGSDFICGQLGMVLSCKARTPSAASSYKALQMQLARALPLLPRPPKIEIEINGEIGPSTTLGAQVILQALARAGQLPPELTPLAIAPAEQAIQSLAMHADVVAGEIDRAITANPDVLRSDPEMPPEMTLGQWAKGVFTKKRLIVGGIGLASILGVIGATWAAAKRSCPGAERSTFLPPPETHEEEEAAEP